MRSAVLPVHSWEALTLTGRRRGGLFRLAIGLNCQRSFSVARNEQPNRPLQPASSATAREAWPRSCVGCAQRRHHTLSLRCAPARWLLAQPFDALDARQSEFCGEDTTAGVDMRKLRFRPRLSCPGGGCPRVLFLPIPFPINAMGSVAKAGDKGGRPKAISRTGQAFPGWRGRVRDAVARI